MATRYYFDDPTYTSSGFYPDVCYATAGSAAFPAYAFSTDVDTGMYLASDADIGFSCAGSVAMTISGTSSVVSIESFELDLEGGQLRLAEKTAPSGSTNAARIYAQDNGSGKTQLMVIFGSGAAQQIAIEP